MRCAFFNEIRPLDGRNPPSVGEIDFAGEIPLRGVEGRILFHRKHQLSISPRGGASSLSIDLHNDDCYNEVK